ncbi:hypothetical protein CPE01_01940 [Cellulomonas persica]|uniref:DUF6318 domain-containing protein n=2 Tax=Cellulomonas persica TaxID=76861 RepID=A0A510USL7_9CELL|nr:hypothetical protein CPE01_01940 [Cellulomonas persica]
MTALLLLATLTACTQETPTPPRTQTPGPTVSAGPTSSPSPMPSASPSVAPSSGPNQDVTVEPERPEALQGPATEENAVAVAKYHLALYSYIVATGDLEQWDSLAAKGCRYCASGREVAVAIHEAGNHGVGGAVDLHAGTATLDDDGTFLVDIAFTEYPSQTVSADGALVEDFPDTSEMKATMRLSWSGSKWKVEGVQIDDFDEQQ